MMESILILVLGLALLLLGSNLLVVSTERFSSAYSISGFTASFFMIGIATSAPEISISIKSALQNNTVLAVGNSIGSNISNIALVFCLSVFFIKHKDKVMTLPKNMYAGMVILTLSLFALIFSDYSFDTKSWITENDLKKTFSFLNNQKLNSLKNYSFLQSKDSLNLYLIKILEFKKIGSYAPIDYVFPTLEYMSINQRKKKLTQLIKTDLIKNAIQNNELEIF